MNVKTVLANKYILDFRMFFFLHVLFSLYKICIYRREHSHTYSYIYIFIRIHTYSLHLCNHHWHRHQQKCWQLHYCWELLVGSGVAAMREPSCTRLHQMYNFMLDSLKTGIQLDEAEVQEYIYIFTYIHTYSCIFIHIHIHTYSYIFIHIHTYTYSYILIHIHIYSYIFIHVHIYSYMFIHIHFRTYSYIFIYIHTNLYI